MAEIPLPVGEKGLACLDTSEVGLDVVEQERPVFAAAFFLGGGCLLAWCFCPAFLCRCWGFEVLRGSV